MGVAGCVGTMKRGADLGSSRVLNLTSLPTSVWFVSPTRSLLSRLVQVGFLSPTVKRDWSESGLPYA